MDDQRQIDTVSPYDPPERQELERQLENDTHLEQQIHATIQQERRLADTAETANIFHDSTDERIKKLEEGEQQWAGYMVQDQQAIDHWDSEHPGWEHAADTTPADDSIYDDAGSADSSDEADTSDQADDSTSGDDGE